MEQSEIEVKLNQLETDLKVLYDYLKNPTTDKSEHALVSLKMLAMRIEFNIDHKLCPSYQIKDPFQANIDKATEQTLSFVSIENGQVIISQEFKNFKK